MQKPLVIAHRGDSSRAVENSLEAFQLALSVPADIIEFDLRMSRDKVLYALHDKNTGRTADRTVDIEQASSQEIGRVRLRNGEPVPALEDVFKLVAGAVGLNIEIKSAGAGAALVDSLSRYRQSGPVIVSSFKESEILSVRTALPDLPLAVIYDTFSIRHIAEYKSRGYGLISLRKNTVTEPLVKACHAQGLQLYVWTVDDEEEMKRCIAWEADGIYTNKPAVLKELIGKFPVAKIR